MSPTGGPPGGRGGRASRPSARVRFTPNRAQLWAGDGSKTDGFHTFVRLRPRVGPAIHLFYPKWTHPDKMESRGGVGLRRIRPIPGEHCAVVLFL